MVWTVGRYVEHGEIDCRELGRVTGRVWLRGLEGPVRLSLEGTVDEDLAGHRLSFKNLSPETMPENQRSFSLDQRGQIAEMTAARKMKVLDFPVEVLEELDEDIGDAPFHWANGLHLEWYGEDNRRVVIQSTDFALEIDPSESRSKGNARLPEALLDPSVDDPDDAPQSALEADAAAGYAEMETLVNRINARLANCTEIDAETPDRIMREERDRLRKELGQVEIEPGSWLEDAEDLIWDEEYEARTEELLEEDLCPVDEAHRHPLVVRCQDLSLRLQNEIEDHGWVQEPATREHPLHEITNSLCSAAAKLAGGLNLQDFWPPDSYFAATALPRLKKARRFLREAIIGVHAARKEKLALPEWLDAVETDVSNLYEAACHLIAQARRAIEEKNDPYF